MRSDTLKEIARLIDGLASQDDLREVNQMVKDRWDTLVRRNVREWSIGDRVAFETKGQRVTGTVEKINRKTVGVQPDDGGRGWRVSPGMLEEV